MSAPSFGTGSAVLFDLDGTLIDAFPPIVSALNQTLREFGKEEMTEVAIKRHTGRGGEGIEPLFPGQVQEAGKRFLELHDALHLKQIRALDGAETMLQWLLERQIPVAVVTSKGEQRAEIQIETLGWSRYFGAIIGRVDGRPEKPSPVPVLMACESLGRTADKCLMIGDGIGDMIAGSCAGLFTVGIVDSFSEEELVENGARLCFSSLGEVHQWLQKIA